MLSSTLTAGEFLYESPLQFMDEVIRKFYPQIFESGSILIEKAATLQETADHALIVPLAEKICASADTLYTKEKEELFPFISQLHETGEKSGCKPFKNVKQDYVALLVSINTLRLLVQEERYEENDIPSGELLSALTKLEQQNIRLFTTKEKYLFADFRECTGCSSLK